jgi:hypothetical protein
MTLDDHGGRFQLRAQDEIVTLMSSAVLSCGHTGPSTEGRHSTCVMAFLSAGIYCPALNRIGRESPSQSVPGYHDVPNGRSGYVHMARQLGPTSWDQGKYRRPVDIQTVRRGCPGTSRKHPGRAATLDNLLAVFGRELWTCGG